MKANLSRRELLIASSAAAFNPWNFWRRAETKPVGWAILGLGYYATAEIMPSFAHCEHSKIVAFISGHPAKLDRYGDEYHIPSGSRYTYARMDEIRHNPEIDVVYVITPPATHPDFTIRAAAAGKHVCSEKPMAPTASECRRMIDACRKAGRLLQIGYRSLYENHNRRAIAAMRNGELGKVHSIRSDHGFDMGPGTWRTQKALAGGGSMMDIGIYSLSALQYLMGQEPTLVTATITNPPNDPRFVDVEDTVDFQLDFPGFKGAIGTSGYSWRQGKNRYEVVGEKGTMLAEPATPYEGHRLTIDGKEVEVKANNQFAAQVDHMSQAVRSGHKVLTPGEMGLQDIRLVQAIYRSAATKQPVKVG